MKIILVLALGLMGQTALASEKSNCAQAEQDMATQLFEAHVNGVPNAGSPEGLGEGKKVGGVFVAQGEYFTSLQYANSLHVRVTIKLALNDSCTLSSARVTEKVLSIEPPADERRRK